MAIEADPVKDFTAITAAVEVPIILVVHPSIPGTTVQDLIGNQIPAVFTTLSTALPHIKAVQSPDVRGKLEAAGMPVVGTSSDEFARMVKDDIETFRKIVINAGIKPE